MIEAKCSDYLIFRFRAKNYKEYMDFVYNVLYRLTGIDNDTWVLDHFHSAFNCALEEIEIEHKIILEYNNGNCDVTIFILKEKEESVKMFNEQFTQSFRKIKKANIGFWFGNRPNWIREISRDFQNEMNLKYKL